MCVRVCVCVHESVQMCEFVAAITPCRVCIPGTLPEHIDIVHMYLYTSVRGLRAVPIQPGYYFLLTHCECTVYSADR